MQQARNLSFTGLFERIRFLIHDRDSKFTASFNEVFGSEGITVIHTPVRAPQANAYAERFVRTVRTECLDWILIVGRRHLEAVLRIYVQHYNRERPHRGLALQPPEPPKLNPLGDDGVVQRCQPIDEVRRWPVRTEARRRLHALRPHRRDGADVGLAEQVEQPQRGTHGWDTVRLRGSTICANSVG